MLNIVCIAAAVVVAQPEAEREMRNYTAEMNAPILLIPEEERAWRVYKQATLALEPAPEWFETGFESVLSGQLTPKQIGISKRKPPRMGAIRKAELRRWAASVPDASPRRDSIRWIRLAQTGARTLSTKN